MAESAQIQKMSHKHEAILNHILANPTQKLGEVAGEFEVTQAWLSTIIWSHAFQNQLAMRQNELFDTAVLQDLGSKLNAAAHMTLDEYMEKVPNLTADQLISGSDKILGRLGFGSRAPSGTTIQGDVNQTVVHNHVSKEILDEARSRIGTHKVGQADSAPALPHSDSKNGVEIEGVLVREKGERSAD